MASPQLENGYTRIANQILDALIASGLSGQDFKITLLVIRKTYGFNKCEDYIPLSQIMAATGMGKIRCSQVVNRLQLMKILTVNEYINGTAKKYKLNKDFEEWQTVNVYINRYTFHKRTVNEKRNKPLRKTLTSKDNTKGNTKDNIYNSNFLLFWNAYPKKTGSKKSAFDVWVRSNGKMPDVNIIIEALRSQKKWPEEATGFVPEWKDASRWLKERMWEIEIQTNDTEWEKARKIIEAREDT